MADQIEGLIREIAAKHGIAVAIPRSLRDHQRFPGNGLSNLPDLRGQGRLYLRNGRRHLDRRWDRARHLIAPPLPHTAVRVVHIDAGGFAHRIDGRISGTSALRKVRGVSASHAVTPIRHSTAS